MCAGITILSWVVILSRPLAVTGSATVIVSKIFSIGITADNGSYLCEYGLPVFDLSTKTKVPLDSTREIKEKIIAHTPCTISDINAWREIKMPHSFI